MARKKIIHEEPVEIDLPADLEEVEVSYSPEVVVSPTKRRSYRGVKVLLGLFGVFLLVLIGSTYYFHWFGFGLSAEASEKREAVELQANVSKLIIMTTDELPVVAKVSDATSLRKAQAFYSHAENDDVLLIYNNAQRAILYRPSKHILVNVGPIYIDDRVPDNTPN